VFSQCSRTVEACSRIFWNTNNQAVAVARTMDLFLDDKPRLVFLPRAIARRGVADGNAARWTSKYASIAAVGLDISPTDGMNEAGLAAHLLYLHGSAYEPADQRPEISNLIWAQYALDNFASVAEALEGMKQVRAVPKVGAGHEWPLHLALEDASGDSAIIEYVSGKMVVHHGKEFTVMTNEPAMDEQLANLKRYKLFGGDRSMPGDIDPMSRFVRASSYLKTLPAPASEQEAIGYLAGLSRTIAVPFGAMDTSGSNATDAWPTRWGTVADLTHKRFYFLSVHSPNVFWVDMAKFDPASSSILAADAHNAELSGDISSQMKPLAPVQSEYPPAL
jgi:penicillin V acylase-like amidase (Ntn superfamily)